MPKTFVKSATTSTSVSNSRRELDKILRRYGASQLSVAEDWERGRITISFVVPNSPDKDAPRIPVQLPIDTTAIYDALYGRPTRSKFNDETKRWDRITDRLAYNDDQLKQAERVAWRNLVLWVDAALSAATARLQTITEALFAHTVVGTGNGPRRMVDVIEELQDALPSGVRALLASPADVIVE